MRPRRSSTACIALALGALATTAGAQGNRADGGGAAFLLMPVGARAAGLGQAAVADGGTSEAAFWNPAGLATMPRSEFAIHYARTFVSNNTALAIYHVDSRLGVVGVSAYIVDLGSQDITMRGQPDPIGRLAPKNIELLASYATELVGPLALGVSYKLIQFRQDCSGNCGTAPSIAGTTHAVDLGVQYGAGPTDALTIGLALRHAGFRLQLENRDQADPLPTRLQLGVAYRVQLPAHAATGRRLDARFLVDLQEAWGEYGSPEALVGIDFGYRDVVRIRTGYALVHAETRGPSIGLGLQFERFSVDFARSFFESGSFDEPAYLSVRIFL